MRRHLKNYLIPHEGNDHKPHLVREASVLAISLVVVLIFGFSIFQSILIRTSDEFMAAVIPAVLVDLANEDRANEGLSTLTVNPVLEAAARMKAEHMSENEYFAHVSPDGVDPWYWFHRSGYKFEKAGENLAINFVDSNDVARAWMDSPGHRANILNGGFTEIGIAAVSGTYKGKKTIYVVQLFGAPAKTPVAVATPAPITPVAVTEPARSEAAVAGEQADVLSEVTETPAVTPEPAPTVTAKVNEAVIWEELLARPRALVEWGYLALGLLVSLVLLSMIYMRVHRLHSRNMLYGTALLTLIGLLFYFNYLLLSADLLIV